MNGRCDLGDWLGGRMVNVLWLCIGLDGGGICYIVIGCDFGGVGGCVDEDFNFYDFCIFFLEECGDEIEIVIVDLGF